MYVKKCCTVLILIFLCTLTAPLGIHASNQTPPPSGSWCTRATIAFIHVAATIAKIGFTVAGTAACEHHPSRAIKNAPSISLCLKLANQTLYDIEDISVQKRKALYFISSVAGKGLVAYGMFNGLTADSKTRRRLSWIGTLFCFLDEALNIQRPTNKSKDPVKQDAHVEEKNNPISIQKK